MKFNLEINGKGMLLVLLVLISLIVSIFAFAGDPLEKVRPKVCNSTFVWRSSL